MHPRSGAPALLHARRDIALTARRLSLPVIGKERRTAMRKQILGACLALAAFAAAAAGVENKWRLQFSGNAESDGRIVLELAPSEGEPIRASADIARGLGENDVARSVRQALQA